MERVFETRVLEMDFKKASKQAKTEMLQNFAKSFNIFQKFVKKGRNGLFSLAHEPFFQLVLVT